jgi:hypothetical protein
MARLLDGRRCFPDLGQIRYALTRAGMLEDSMSSTMGTESDSYSIGGVVDPQGRVSELTTGWVPEPWQKLRGRPIRGTWNHDQDEMTTETVVGSTFACKRQQPRKEVPQASKDCHVRSRFSGMADEGWRAVLWDEFGAGPGSFLDAVRRDWRWDQVAFGRLTEAMVGVLPGARQGRGIR